jgi:hypothetical protein
VGGRGDDGCRVVVLRGWELKLGARFMHELHRGGRPAQRRTPGQDVPGPAAPPALGWVMAIQSLFMIGKPDAICRYWLGI